MTGDEASQVTPIKPLRVALVDDSLTIRRLLRMVLDAAPDIEVVGEASDPIEARRMIKAVDPDVLTLDVDMPRMDGLEFLEKIMRLRPMPVVMISSHTSAGSDVAIEALALGAVDVFGKPQGPATEAWKALPDIVRAAGRSRAAQARPRSAARVAEGPSAGQGADFVWNGRLIAIGASTGGVDALEQVLGVFPTHCPPTLVTQHMPATFLESLVRRLNGRLAPQVMLAEHGQVLAKGVVYVAPGGGAHMQVHPDGKRIVLQPGDKVAGHRPSVDRLFGSLAQGGTKATGALLTGMGRDGAQGLLEMRQAGCHTVAQDEESSTVFGMPRAAQELGAAVQVLSLERIGAALLNSADRNAQTSKAPPRRGRAG